MKVNDYYLKNQKGLIMIDLRYLFIDEFDDDYLNLAINIKAKNTKLLDVKAVYL